MSRTRILPVLMSVAICVTAIQQACCHRTMTLSSKLKDDSMCETCHVAARVLSDYLCDFEFVGAAVRAVEENVCTAIPQKDECMEVQHAMRDDTAQCAQCRYVVNKVKADLSSAAPTSSIVDAAQKACTALPGELEASCHLMVMKWGTLLNTLIGFDQACELLGPCAWSALEAEAGQAKALEQGHRQGHKQAHGQRLVVPLPLVQTLHGIRSSVESQLGDASSCDKCKLSVLEMRMVINSATAQRSIVNVTRMACDYLAPYEDRCRWVIDTYSPVAFQLIDKYFQPDPVCQLLHLCEAKLPRQGQEWHDLVAGPSEQGLAWFLFHRVQRLWSSMSSPGASGYAVATQ